MSHIKNFFSTSNEINENTVVGSVFAIATIVSTFVPLVSPDKYWTLAGLTAAFFGLGALKK